MPRILVLLLAALASAAYAESNTMTGRPGFFEPTPDGNSSISRIVTPEEAAMNRAPRTAAMPTPAPANVVAVPAPNVVTVPVPSNDTPAEAARKAEVDMDRAEREHQEMAARAAQSLPIAEGAYNGLTSERDR